MSFLIVASNRVHNAIKSTLLLVPPPDAYQYEYSDHASDRVRLQLHRRVGAPDKPHPKTPTIFRNQL
jgi:hypothetical protein